MVFDKVFKQHWGPCEPVTYGESHQNLKTGKDVDEALALEAEAERQIKLQNNRTKEPAFPFVSNAFGHKARECYVDVGVQCNRIVAKSPAITSTARFFALSARHAALLDEINDLNEEIEYLTSKLRVVEDQRREVLAQCATYLDCSFKLRSDLKLFISKEGQVALKNPEKSNRWVFLN